MQFYPSFTSFLSHSHFVCSFIFLQKRTRTGKIHFDCMKNAFRKKLTPHTHIQINHINLWTLFSAVHSNLLQRFIFAHHRLLVLGICISSSKLVLYGIFFFFHIGSKTNFQMHLIQVATVVKKTALPNPNGIRDCLFKLTHFSMCILMQISSDNNSALKYCHRKFLSMQTICQ